MAAEATHLAEAYGSIEQHKLDAALANVDNQAAILVCAGQLGCQGHELLESVLIACTVHVCQHNLGNCAHVFSIPPQQVNKMGCAGAHTVPDKHRPNALDALVSARAGNDDCRTILVHI